MGLKELRKSLKLYKECVGETRLKVREDKRQAVGEHQLRILLWEPWEYLLVVYVEEEGLAHCVPFTVFCDLTTCQLRLKLKDKIFAPLPFMVYIRKEVLEEESIVFAKVRPQTVSFVVDHIRKSPRFSVLRPKREFLKLVWKRYEDLSLSSIIYTHTLREEKQEQPKAVIIPFPTGIEQKYQTLLRSFQLVAKGTKALRGKNWLGVVEDGKIVIYLQEDTVGKKLRLKLFEEVLYEGIAEERIVLENVPDHPSYEYLEEYIHVEILEH